MFSDRSRTGCLRPGSFLMLKIFRYLWPYRCDHLHRAAILVGNTAGARTNCRRAAARTLTTRYILRATALAMICFLVTAQADVGRVHHEGHVFEEIVVSGRAVPLIGSASSASEGRIAQVDLARRPTLRVGELLEVVPGAAVTQHSGTGKANQFFLRGFNLDHGTDFAGYLDGVPLNQPSHGHGQGYLDLNPIIPELVETIEFGKGPYYVNVGDFSSAGYARYSLARHMHKPLLQLTGGENDFMRLVAAGSSQLVDGDLLGAVEVQFGNGPWAMDEDAHKLNALVRYSGSRGSADYSFSALAYDAEWDSTDQVALRAVREGFISRLGNLDPTLGGASSRYSANAEFAVETEHGHYHANAYAVYTDFSLISNFTYLLDDAVNGDQITQTDQRWTTGLNANYERRYTAFGIDSTSVTGIQLRRENINELRLQNSTAGIPRATIRADKVRQTSLGLFVSNEARLTTWLRTRFGLRADHHRYSVDNPLDANSGDKSDTLLSPKAALILGPWGNSEIYLNYGHGFHSNDARGVLQHLDPSSGDLTMPVDALVASWGAELGVRTQAVDGLVSTLSFWYLELDSELLFVGDAGTTEPQGGSYRYGVEWSNFYEVNEWLQVDADIALTQSRFQNTGDDDIPNSIGRVITVGANVDLPSGMFATLRLRHFGDSPLTEDGTVYAEPTTVVNLRAGYRWSSHLQLALDVFNLFDSKDADISYYFASCLPNDPAERCGVVLTERTGVDDIHLHPVEPRQVRATLRWTF